ncbi:hypothetical protein HN481_00785 [Candidatus Parcubacteria bacterium]|jgi:hypothetical protein|nr:hypothetical protein [Candidatus Parcubacteria bacterium]
MYKKIIFLVIIFCLGLGFGIFIFGNKGFNDYETIDITKTNYLGSTHEGNFVWGGAMNLAWNEMSENIIKEKEIRMATQDPIALYMIKSFNTQFFNKNNLDSKSYYIKSGFGQNTVDLINKESKQKFPEKTFKDLKIELQKEDFIVYSYFLKEVEYPDQFKERTVSFLENKVKGFYAGSDQYKNVLVYDYINDDKFTIKLALKDEEDELFILKGYQDKIPEKLVDHINKLKNSSDNPRSINNVDSFEMPKISFEFRRDYEELIDKFFLNEGFENHYISEMFENIKFKLDHKGARVENEAVIVGMFATAGPGSREPKPRHFILDKPFWIVMKRQDSQIPYFILGINNTEMMDKTFGL